MKQHLVLRTIVSAMALAIAVFHLRNPHIVIDSSTIILLVVSSLPWLQPLVKSVKLPGLEVELQDLKDRIDEAKGAAASARQEAQLATATAQFSGVRSVPNVPTDTDRSRREPDVAPQAQSSAESADARIQALVEEYERIRETQRASDARTANMAAVVGRMMDLARQNGNFNVAEALRNGGKGLRLYAYAHLYVRPDPNCLDGLVNTIASREDTPFGQYWGLRAVGQVVPAAPRVSVETKERLKAFGEKLQRGTDRDYECRRILVEIGLK